MISGIVLSYVCGLPFDTLDERTIKYLYETSVENMDNIIDMIDNEENLNANNKNLNMNFSVADELEKLNTLKEKGIISEAEFEEMSKGDGSDWT